MSQSALFHLGCESLRNEATKKERMRKNWHEKETKRTKNKAANVSCTIKRLVYVRKYEFMVCCLGYSKYIGHVQYFVCL